MNERKTKAVQDSSQRSDSPVQTTDAADRLPTVQKEGRPKIQRHRKSAKEASNSTGAAIVPSSQELTRRAQPSASSRREITRFFATVPEAIAVRDACLEAEYQNEVITTNMPKDVASFLDKWLRRNHLMFSARDQEFWDAFSNVLTSIEGFSVEAVEEALKICLAGARTTPRRLAVYAELRSVRELRKIRNLSLKLQTSKLLVDRYLVRESDMVKGDFESNHPGTFTTPFKVGDKVVHEIMWGKRVEPNDIGEIVEIDDTRVTVQFPELTSHVAYITEWRRATVEEIAMAANEARREAQGPEEVSLTGNDAANTSYFVEYLSADEEAEGRLMPDKKQFRTEEEANEFLQTLSAEAEGEIQEVIIDENGHKYFIG